MRLKSLVRAVPQDCDRTLPKPIPLHNPRHYLYRDTVVTSARNDAIWNKTHSHLGWNPRKQSAGDTKHKLSLSDVTLESGGKTKHELSVTNWSLRLAAAKAKLWLFGGGGVISTDRSSLAVVENDDTHRVLATLHQCYTTCTKRTSLPDLTDIAYFTSCRRLQDCKRCVTWRSSDLNVMRFHGTR